VLTRALACSVTYDRATRTDRVSNWAHISVLLVDGCVLNLRVVSRSLVFRFEEIAQLTRTVVEIRAVSLVTFHVTAINTICRTRVLR
jgi:hypothetical protein